MKEKLLEAVYSGTLDIAGQKIPCAVLDDETRVLRERSVARALGKKGSGAYWQKKKSEKGALLPEYISTQNLNEFINEETREQLLNPITYKLRSGNEANGMPATLLPEICNIWLQAREKGALYKNQENTAKKAEILMRGLAVVGIIALVDEATGYQDFRTRKILEEYLNKFIAKELRPWTETFQEDYFKEMFRLRGLPYNPDTAKRPQYFGHYTNDFVYSRMAPKLVDELKKKNPRTPKGYRKHKNFQWLSEDFGHPKLREHLAAVIALMRAATKWEGFKRSMERALPKYGDTMVLPIPDGEE